MRGRPYFSCASGGRVRNTPAYAGKTLSAGHQSSSIRKHPRVCGEDAPRAISWRGALETPPRMRGRLKKARAQVQRDRNTPAYAGKTRRYGRTLKDSWKHPRVCGEDKTHETISLGR